MQLKSIGIPDHVNVGHYAPQPHQKGAPAAAHVGATPSGDAGRPGAAAAGDRRERWEEGAPDYSGSASFENILKKIEKTMTSPGESSDADSAAARLCSCSSSS